MMLIFYISEQVKRPGAMQKKIAVDSRVMKKQLDELVEYGFADKYLLVSRVNQKTQL
jgi:DNA-binding HxlR family transcriptional regulator